jgi:hypothetical protein
MSSQTHKFYISRVLVIFSSILLGFLTTAAVFANNDVSTNRNPVADFDGDGKSDISVFRPSDGFWHIMKSTGGFSSIQWGQKDDQPVPGDYDGDGKTDTAVFRYFRYGPDATENTWYIRRSSDNTFFTKQLGRTPLYTSNEPVPADYDSDGKTDLAVYDVQDYIPASGNFRILQSLTESRVFRQWGFTTDKRVAADYDGDGKADIAVFRGATPLINLWWLFCLKIK